MDERHLENQRIQAFLSSQQFIRSCEVMETYQQLLVDHRGDQAMCENFKERFHKIFPVKTDDNQDGDENMRALIAESMAMREQVFAWCENNEFTRQKVAELYARSSVANKVLDRWNPKAGTRSLGGNIIVNEILEYSNAGLEDKKVGINIFPTPVKGTAELLVKVLDGMQKVAKELKSGALQHVEKVEMTSWLFGPDFEQKIKEIFGENIVLDDVSDGSEFEVQMIALSYNKRAMSKYLTTGELPPVRSLVMNRDEFIAKFAV